MTTVQPAQPSRTAGKPGARRRLPPVHGSSRQDLRWRTRTDGAHPRAVLNENDRQHVQRQRRRLLLDVAARDRLQSRRARPAISAATSGMRLMVSGAGESRTLTAGSVTAAGCGLPARLVRRLPLRHYAPGPGLAAPVAATIAEAGRVLSISAGYPQAVAASAGRPRAVAASASGRRVPVLSAAIQTRYGVLDARGVRYPTPPPARSPAERDRRDRPRPSRKLVERAVQQTVQRDLGDAAWRRSPRALSTG